MELSNFESAVVYLANTRIVSYTLKGATSESEKRAACALKLFLDDAVRSGQLVEFIRASGIEERIK